MKNYSEVQGRAEMVRFNLDIFLDTFIQLHPDLLEGDDFATFLLAVRALLKDVADHVGPMQSTALSMTVQDLQAFLEEERQEVNER